MPTPPLPYHGWVRRDGAANTRRSPLPAVPASGHRPPSPWSLPETPVPPVPPGERNRSARMRTITSACSARAPRGSPRRRPHWHQLAHRHRARRDRGGTAGGPPPQLSAPASPMARILQADLLSILNHQSSDCYKTLRIETTRMRSPALACNAALAAPRAALAGTARQRSPARVETGAETGRGARPAGAGAARRRGPVGPGRRPGAGGGAPRGGAGGGRGRRRVVGGFAAAR